MSEIEDMKTIAEVERTVLASGECAGIGEIEFSTDGEHWRAAWRPTEGEPTPVFARVAVRRRGFDEPVRSTVVWDERFPAGDPEWAARWLGAPTVHFGRAAKMAAFRAAFRDLVGTVVVEGETTAEQPAEAPVDWSARIAACETVDELTELGKVMKRVRAFTTVLDREWRARRTALTAPPAEQSVLDGKLAELAERAADDERARHARPTPRVLDRKRGA